MNVGIAAEALRRGEVVGMPTETVYGLAGVATDVDAVARIFAVKERPTFDPLIVHVGRRAGLDGVVDVARLGARRRVVERLMESFWPGALTLVLPRAPGVPDLVTSGMDTVAVRMPAHPVALALIDAVGAPLAAPSANRFGRISPTSAEDVEAELGERIGIVLDGGRCAIGVESTIVGVGVGVEGLVLLRPGGVPVGEIEAACGERVSDVRDKNPPTQAAAGGMLAPGMMASHYAPRKRLILLDGLGSTTSPSPSPSTSPITSTSTWTGSLASELPARIGVLAMRGEVDELVRTWAARTGREVIVRVLSPSGDLVESARNLFAALRALDASPAELLLAEPCQPDGLGHAILDRLSRAAHRG